MSAFLTRWVRVLSCAGESYLWAVPASSMHLLPQNPMRWGLLFSRNAAQRSAPIATRSSLPTTSTKTNALQNCFGERLTMRPEFVLYSLFQNGTHRQSARNEGMHFQRGYDKSGVSSLWFSYELFESLERVSSVAPFRLTCVGNGQPETRRERHARRWRTSWRRAGYRPVKIKSKIKYNY